LKFYIINVYGYNLKVVWLKGHDVGGLVLCTVSVQVCKGKCSWF